MLLLVEAILSVYASGDGLPWPVYLVVAVVCVIIGTASSRQFLIQWLNGIRGRDWPEISAVIDLVSVQKRVESTGRGTYVTYVAMLTYVYHNPELQTGDYDRLFQSEDEAQAWANSYKGSTVKVHVDPRDPAHSVLRKEDL